MRFLFILMMLVYSVNNVLAQNSEEPLLFPELSAFDDASQRPKQGEKVETEGQTGESDIPDFEVSKIQDKDLFADKKEDFTPPEEKDIQQKQEDDEEDDRGQDILLLVDDVRATLTPSRDASFCFASWKMMNNLKKTVKTLSGSLTIGTMTKEFKFTNVEKGRMGEEKYTFLGTSCEKILDPPEYTVQTCEVEGWSEKKCKNKIKFVPISKEENTFE